MTSQPAPEPIDNHADEEFQRVQALIAAQLAAGDFSGPAELMKKYMVFCETQGFSEENMMRCADLIALFSGTKGLQVVRSLLPQLRPRLTDLSLPLEAHREVVTCLTSIARTAAELEDFDTVTTVGRDLEISAAADRAGHGICCGAAAGTLVPESKAEKVLEQFMKKRDDAFARTATALLRYSGTAGAEAALSRLETEEAGQNRKTLMRLIGQLGTSALEAARLRLKSGTWYVVRNVCTVLQELHDPDLAQHLRPALVHEDARVQQAAFNAITKGRAAGRAEVISNCLISLHPHVLELALDELAFLKDPKSVPGLTLFSTSSEGRSAAIMLKAVAALRAIGGGAAMEGVGRILRDVGAPIPARKAAVEALRWSMQPEARKQLDDFATSPDPLAREYVAKATGR
jgi:HEAT repeat protein